MNFVSDILAQRLKNAISWRDYEPGETLFRTQDKSGGLFILKAGRVRLLRRGADGHDIVLHIPNVEESFAEAAVFADEYHCDCVADIQSRAGLVPRANFMRELEREPYFALLFAKHMAGQVRDLRAGLALRNIRSAHERVFAALELKKRGPDLSLIIEPNLKAFASEIGLTHEALYRSLKKLEQAGLIRREGKAIWLTA